MNYKRLWIGWDGFWKSIASYKKAKFIKAIPANKIRKPEKLH